MTSPTSTTKSSNPTFPTTDIPQDRGDISAKLDEIQGQAKRIQALLDSSSSSSDIFSGRVPQPKEEPQESSCLGRCCTVKVCCCALQCLCGAVCCLFKCWLANEEHKRGHGMLSAGTALGSKGATDLATLDVLVNRS